MGLRIRKSFGGKNFRINISKSGIGYSYGVPGFRKTQLPSGRTRTTASIPGTGISYVSESGGKKKSTSNSKSNFVQENIIDLSKDIDNVEKSLFEESSHEEFTKAIKKAKKFYNISTGCIIFGIILLLTIVYAFGAMLFLISGIGLYIYFQKKLKVNVEYNIEDGTIDEYKQFKEVWLKVNKCKKIWEIVSETRNSNTKTHAGAGRSVDRVVTKFEETKLPYLNIGDEKILKLKLRKKEVLFLKDKIIIFEKDKVGSVDYKDLRLEFSDQKFVESESVTKDATIVDYTWEYVNKNGQADKRYANNRQLPVCLYGKINISDKNNTFNIELQISSHEVYKDITNQINEVINKK